MGTGRSSPLDQTVLTPWTLGPPNRVVDRTLDRLRLLIPTAGALLALPFSLRGRNERTTIQAAYLFHESGDPLATVASAEAIPFEPDQLEPVLKALRTFVTAPEPTGRGLAQTSERFGDEGFIGIRGRYVSACAVIRGNGEANLRKDLARFVREFEDRNAASLTTWEQAVRLADEAARDLSDLVNGPSPSRPSEPQGGGSDQAAIGGRSVGPVGESGAASGPSPMGSA